MGNTGVGDHSSCPAYAQGDAALHVARRTPHLRIAPHTSHPVICAVPCAHCTGPKGVLFCVWMVFSGLEGDLIVQFESWATTLLKVADIVTKGDFTEWVPPRELWWPIAVAAGGCLAALLLQSRLMGHLFQKRSECACPVIYGKHKSRAVQQCFKEIGLAPLIMLFMGVLNRWSMDVVL